MCVYVERKIDRERVCVERKSECVHCALKRRDGERERESVCVCVCVERERERLCVDR